MGDAVAMADMVAMTDVELEAGEGVVVDLSVVVVQISGDVLYLCALYVYVISIYINVNLHTCVCIYSLIPCCMSYLCSSCLEKSGKSMFLVS